MSRRGSRPSTHWRSWLLPRPRGPSRPSLRPIRLLSPILERAFNRFRYQVFSQWTDAQKSADMPAVVRKGLTTPALQARAVELASALGDPTYAPDLLTLAKSETADAAVRAAALDAVAGARDERYLADFDRLSKNTPAPVQLSAVHAIGMLKLADLESRAQAILLSDASNEARSEALRILARTPAGLAVMADLKEAGKFPTELDRLATTLVHRMAGRGPASPALDRAAKAFPPVVTANNRSVPTVFQMEQQFRPDPAAGRKIFDSLCATCHSTGGARQMGPDLSAIGTKLDRQALLDAIVMPSAAIAFGYESWTLETTSNGTVTGLLVENTPQRVTVKVDATQEVRLKPEAITSRKPIPFSTMPEGLVSAMTPQQIVDLIGFLTTLKATGAPGSSR